MGTTAEARPLPRRLVTAQELAEYLSVPLSWVHRHASPSAPNPLPHRKAGRHLRFDLEEIDKWLQRERSGNGAEWAEALEQ